MDDNYEEIIAFQIKKLVYVMREIESHLAIINSELATTNERLLTIGERDYE